MAQPVNATVPSKSDVKAVIRTMTSRAAPWTVASVIAIGAYQLVLAQGRSFVNLVFILFLLGLLAGASLIGRTVGVLTMLAVGVLLAWPLPTQWLRSTWSSDISLNAASQDLRWIGGMTLLIVALVLAIWRRPPARSPDGTFLVASRLVNWLALLCIFGGPVIGLAAFSAFTPRDIYGRLAVLGLAVGLYGLLLFSGYSAFHVLIGRPGRAAVLAAVYPALLLLLAVAWPR